MRWTVVAGLALAFGAALVSLVLPIGKSGLWDPAELELTEWARRAAIHLFGAERLAVPGANNAIPTVEEVGRGELPVHASALAFKVFGLSQWAVRLPLVLFGILGAAALSLCCWRLSGRRAAAFAAVILATMPLYFSHARTALGDGLTMACLAGAFSGFALACFDARLSGAKRALCALAGLGFAAMGFYCRGAWIGVALPTLSTGAAALLMGFGWRANPGSSRVDRFGSSCGAALFALGLAFAGLGLMAALRASPDEYWMLLGSKVSPGKKLPTHDSVFHALGHGLFPWSAFAPLALGLLLRAPSGEGGKQRREAALRLSLLLVVALGVGVYGFLAPLVGELPFGAVFGLAGLLALALVEFDRRKEGAPILAIATVALLVILYKDFDNQPGKVLSAFSVGVAELPEGFASSTRRAIQIVTALCLPVFVVLAVERLRLVRWPFEKLRQIWLRTAWAERLPLSGPRGLAVITAMSAGGLLLSLGYYPALASQLSPVGAFETYRELSRPGELLATLGSEPRNAIYFGGAPERYLKTEAEAVSWLSERSPQRRWLVLSDDRLAALNSRFRREGPKPPRHLPVLMAGAGDSVLVSDRLAEGELNKNPFNSWILTERPKPERELLVKFESQLQLLGWGIRDRNGAATSQLKIGEPYEFRMYYEVLAPIARSWQAFIHIDGHDRRLNGDHDLLSGRYPLRLWNAGEFVVDSHELSFDESYRTGDYQVHFGLFSGKTRFTVSKGEHTDNRVFAGTLVLIQRDSTNP